LIVFIFSYCIVLFLAEDAYSNAPRSKRPYDQLESTQRWKRRKEARAAVAGVLERIGCPAEEMLPPSRTSPAELIHLPTSVREQIRAVRSLRIPSERTMAQFLLPGSRR